MVICRISAAPICPQSLINNINISALSQLHLTNRSLTQPATALCAHRRQPSSYSTVVAYCAVQAWESQVQPVGTFRERANSWRRTVICRCGYSTALQPACGSKQRGSEGASIVNLELLLLAVVAAVAPVICNRKQYFREDRYTSHKQLADCVCTYGCACRPAQPCPPSQTQPARPHQRTSAPSRRRGKGGPVRRPEGGRCLRLLSRRTGRRTVRRRRPTDPSTGCSRTGSQL